MIRFIHFHLIPAGNISGYLCLACLVKNFNNIVIDIAVLEKTGGHSSPL